MIKFKFDNRFVAELPADKDISNNTRQVHNACYSLVNPQQTEAPKLVCASAEVVNLIGLSQTDSLTESFVNTFSGNQVLEGMQPYAMCYGGHQFGNWAGQLGDGRAINLGEIIDINGQHQTLQLKGAGLTPYSRTADGLAVLRSSIREFLCSEAMAHLGVPTTRALSLMLTGDQVMRDMFYDGRAALEPGAVVCRVAPSFIRFGNFQLLAARQEIDLLKQLMDFTIRSDFPHLLENADATNASANASPQLDIEVYEKWFDEVCRNTREMLVHWMRVGFVHGVMNTDNMSILGLTIDYGPYGWLDAYEPQWTPNTTDAQGKRYCYENQPKIAQWNLYQLANSLLPVIGRSEALEKSLAEFATLYTLSSQQMYRDKLGLTRIVGDDDDATNQSLIENLLNLMIASETDMSILFRSLAKVKTSTEYSDDEILSIIENSFYSLASIKPEVKQQWIQWLFAYRARLLALKIDDEAREKAMNKINPKYILRNYLAYQAIEQAEQGDFSEVVQLLDIIREPYAEQPQFEKYALKRPEWGRTQPGCSTLSCSS